MNFIEKVNAVYAKAEPKKIKMAVTLFWGKEFHKLADENEIKAWGKALPASITIDLDNGSGLLKKKKVAVDFQKKSVYGKSNLASVLYETTTTWLLAEDEKVWKKDLVAWAKKSKLGKPSGQVEAHDDSGKRAYVVYFDSMT